MKGSGNYNNYRCEYWIYVCRLTHNNQAVNQLNNFAPTQGGGVTPAGEIINAITQ
ncbi:hypothetical protein ACLB1E_17660 [Escherichia coli]